MKRILYVLLAGLMLGCISGCAAEESRAVSQGSNNTNASQEVLSEVQKDLSAGAKNAKDSKALLTDRASKETMNETNTEELEKMEKNTFYVTFGDKTFMANFEDTPGADAFRAMLAEESVTLEMSDYGGFEKVGSLGQNLPTDDIQTTTQAGDIVLYQGNQIVLFYGSNSWSYTRLGKIDDLAGWAEGLGGGTVSVTFSLQRQNTLIG